MHPGHQRERTGVIGQQLKISSQLNIRPIAKIILILASNTMLGFQNKAKREELHLYQLRTALLYQWACAPVGPASHYNH
jgi:hypothetical protein